MGRLFPARADSGKPTNTLAYRSDALRVIDRHIPRDFAIDADRAGLGNSDKVISYSHFDERRDTMGKVAPDRYGNDLKTKVALGAI